MSILEVSFQFHSISSSVLLALKLPNVATVISPFIISGNKEVEHVFQWFLAMISEFENWLVHCEGLSRVFEPRLT